MVDAIPVAILGAISFSLSPHLKARGFLFLSFLSFLAGAVALGFAVVPLAEVQASCPRGFSDPDHNALRLEQDCPAPFSGILLEPEAYLSIKQQLTAADVLIPRLEAEIQHARTERDTILAAAIDRLELSANQLTQVSEALREVSQQMVQSHLEGGPSRVGWAAAGGGAALLCGAVAFFVLSDVNGTWQGVGAGVSGGLCVGTVAVLGAVLN